MKDSIKKYEINLPESVNKDDVLFLVKDIKPSWNTDYVYLDQFSAGTSNKLYGVHKSNKSDELFLLRINGSETKIFVNRQKEMVIMQLLNKFGYAPQIFAYFENALCYDFVKGRCLSAIDVRDPTISEKIARHIAELHALPLVKDFSSCNLLNRNLNHDVPNRVSVVESWISNIPESFKNSYVDKLKLLQELNFLIPYVKCSQSPINLCHNDILAENVVLDKDQISFIDYEYAAFDHIASDIGNHFSEFVGHGEGDAAMFPSKGFRLNWIKTYLEQFNKSCQDSAMKEAVNRMSMGTWMNEVYCFSLLADLTWSAWSVLQHLNSKIEFNFLVQAESRMRNYMEKKNHLVAVDTNGKN